MPVVFYGCENWSLTLREERRLRVFENMVVSIFGPKREAVTEEWRKVMRSLMICIPHQYSSGDQIEKNEMSGTCSTYGGRRGVYRVLMGKPEGNRPTGRPRCRWDDNIKMDLQELGCGSVD